MADPVFYLKAVIGIAALGLIALPYGADAVNLILAPKAADGCRVVSVTDGDTVRIWCPAKGIEKARIMGYDTPEVFSPSCASELARGYAATWALRRMLFGAEELTIVRRGYDRYDRVLIFMAVDGEPVARRMIDGGHARAYAGGKRGSWCR